MWFDFPGASVVVASSSDYATTLFTNFLPLLYLVLGIVVGVLAIRYIIRHTTKGVRQATGMSGKGRGRGRRR